MVVWHWLSRTGTGPYLLSNVACTGVETSIFDCASSGPCSVTNRSPPDVGAVCFSDNSIVVQLVGGITDKEGLVQVVYGSHVGTVCVPETYRSFEAANAVCRQLGYMDGVFTKFPRGSGTVSMSDVFCTGYETSVFMCRSGGLFVPPSDRCANHDFDLGVHCSDGVRLFYTIHNTNNSIIGVVQINRGSGWINICNDFFGDLDAQVVCRSEGYRTRVYCPRARWVTKTETTCLSQP
ncbi:scavenger receptor cysteine-rich domain superfamily protein-like [Pomacea canaliculata]|uniref:scavenger receptor cysteine-rich domain superfamily protein-like n=1 Tax=Pomacea canaliculata TaxID=400727 RepID=UPI000D73CC4F|nr:scavenger receptor cysteine-rich domain superfamily protein-like [Pomacea canaliculata]